MNTEMMTFEDLRLSPELLANIEKAGFRTPTPIQMKTIPLLLEGRDVVGQAQTGTGKTAAYLLPLIESKDRALVLVPTRELAQQVSDQCRALVEGVRVATLYGGQPIVGQFKQLRQGWDIVVATPGRLLDHCRRESLDFKQFTSCVIDEADEMLNFGFLEEVDEIMANLPETRRMALFSATLPPRIEALIKNRMPGAARVTIASAQRTVEGVQQSFCVVPPAHKAIALGRLIDMENPGTAIVFCRTRVATQELTNLLRERGYAAEALHGDMAQAERDRVMERFRNGQVKLLIATDVAARGLDVDSVTHVFNYDIPWDAEQYIHRVGRTARAGRTGSAITLIGPRERRALQMIEKAIRTQVVERQVPTAKDIGQGRRRRLEETLQNQLVSGDWGQQMGIVKTLSKHVDPSQLAAAAIQLLWEQYGYREDDLDETVFATPKPRFERQPFTAPMAWLSMSAGRRDGVQPRDLFHMLGEKTRVGTIQIAETKTFFEVPAERAQEILAGLKRTTVRGKRVKAAMAAAPAPRPPKGR